MKAIYKLFLITLISPLISCSQNSLNTSSYSSFRDPIYDTCYIKGLVNLVPRDFWYSTDKNRNLNKNVDSVLWLKINGSLDERTNISKELKTDALRIDDVHKCSKLGFLEFESSLETNWPKTLDFTNFPELRYFHSDRIMTERQFNDLIKTAKKLKGLEVSINFPIPENISELKDLRYLIITNYGGLTLPSSLKKMQNLKYLELNGGGIGVDEKLNTVVWDIPSLELLEIDGGLNVEIKPTIKKMIHLKHLKITSVQSISICEEFTELDSLEILEISWIENLINFPNNMNQLKSLKALSIAQCSLNILPINENNPNIIYLSYVQIHELTDPSSLKFNNLSNLKHITLSGEMCSYFKYIPSGLKFINSLETLELWGYNDLKDARLLEKKIEAKKIRYKIKLSDGYYSANFKNYFASTFDYYENLFLFGKPTIYSRKAY